MKTTKNDSTMGDKNKLLDFLDEIYPPHFTRDMGDHAIICRGKRTPQGLVMLTDTEQGIVNNIEKHIHDTISKL